MQYSLMLTRPEMIVMFVGSEMDIFVVKVLYLIFFLPKRGSVVGLVKVNFI